MSLFVSAMWSYSRCWHLTFCFPFILSICNFDCVENLSNPFFMVCHRHRSEEFSSQRNRKYPHNAKNGSWLDGIINEKMSTYRIYSVLFSLVNLISAPPVMSSTTWTCGNKLIFTFIIPDRVRMTCYGPLNQFSWLKRNGKKIVENSKLCTRPLLWFVITCFVLEIFWMKEVKCSPSSIFVVPIHVSVTTWVMQYLIQTTTDY